MLIQPKNYANDCRAFLRKFNIFPSEDQDAVLEAILVCKNYQIICDYLLTKTKSTGEYELLKYKFVIDYVMHRFNFACKEIEDYSQEATLISNVLSILSGHEGTLTQNALSKSLTGYRSDMQGYRMIMQAALERMKADSNTTRKKLRLEKDREIDVESMNFVKQLCE
jgi:hypothetical protein